ncbi:MAG TPA: alpha/beta hydrolase-fold protein, partial [Chitinophagaceae bacterium]|nr:alpha/beta hydrolase-fold protein [Chitinophagaceae bacterium]
QLGRSRRVWIYLPPGYASSRERYPVLYMHDGQNVFDEATSFSGEWGVDEALDTLCPGVPPSIIVAIDNGGETRMNEYSPFDMEAYGKGEGAAYADFLALTLKPFIDARFRTLKSRRHTFTAGSSMGGLISFYILLRHPRVFGGAGVFSPAFWVAPAIKEYAATRAKQVKGKIYFFAGQRESESMVPDLLALFQIMNRLSPASMTTVIRAEGKHEEATWRKEFPLFYQWMLCGTAD